MALEGGFTAVYLARHGQTLWNTQGRRQGQLDSPLTTLGVEQVRRNAGLLSVEPVDAVFSSPLGRARASAQVLGASLGLLVVVLEGLGEVIRSRVVQSREYPTEQAGSGCARYRPHPPPRRRASRSTPEGADGLRRTGARCTSRRPRSTTGRVRYGGARAGLQ